MGKGKGKDKGRKGWTTKTVTLPNGTQVTSTVKDGEIRVIDGDLHITK